MEEIKAAYRAQVKKWHPDLFRTYSQKLFATEKLKKLNAAYEILGDPIARATYDRNRTRTAQPMQNSGTVSSSAPPSKPAPKWAMVTIGIVFAGCFLWAASFTSEIFTSSISLTATWWKIIAKGILGFFGWMFVTFMMGGMVLVTILACILFGGMAILFVLEHTAELWKRTEAKAGNLREDLLLRLETLALCGSFTGAYFLSVWYMNELPKDGLIIDYGANSTCLSYWPDCHSSDLNFIARVVHLSNLRATQPECNPSDQSLARAFQFVAQIRESAEESRGTCRNFKRSVEAYFFL